MGNAEINTINIILTLYKMMCNTNVLRAASRAAPEGMFERHTQYRLKSEQKKKAENVQRRLVFLCLSSSIRKVQLTSSRIILQEQKDTGEKVRKAEESVCGGGRVKAPLTALGFLLTFMSNLKQKQRQTLTKKKNKNNNLDLMEKTLVQNQKYSNQKANG